MRIPLLILTQKQSTLNRPVWYVLVRILLEPIEKKISLIFQLCFVSVCSLRKLPLEKVKTKFQSRCKIVFIYNFVPFIFFGFLDNCLMILFGDAIEVFLGVHLGIGTMACAGFGTISFKLLKILTDNID